ncbi:MAG: tRNA pseudouridine(38-40) synthase TruA [Candidatus Bostrichicola ureolyticus]|nr:MAG: tRNA pseudouridine(38-40) synthase TruA [Candidatus Bostrichicola ureolyticus]
MRYFIEVSYNGNNYHGWQIQKNNISIEEVLEYCLSKLLKCSINLIGSGRTDSGVHALQMFAHFDFEKNIEISLVDKLNRFLPKSIKVFRIFRVKNNAHARFDVISRTYQYHILLEKDPFCNDFTWQLLCGKLNIKKMNQASKILIKNRDFSIFCKKSTKSSYCILYKAYWDVNGNKKLCFTIEANRFLRNMVRSIVGTIIKIGKEQLSIEDFIKIIKNKNRNLLGSSAPPYGLFLVKIIYNNKIYE